MGAEIEMPFGRDANDLPILQYQNAMNKSLVILTDYRTLRPPHFHIDESQYQSEQSYDSENSDIDDLAEQLSKGSRKFSMHTGLTNKKAGRKSVAAAQVQRKSVRTLVTTGTAGGNYYQEKDHPSKISKESKNRNDSSKESTGTGDSKATELIVTQCVTINSDLSDTLEKPSEKQCGREKPCIRQGGSTAAEIPHCLFDITKELRRLVNIMDEIQRKMAPKLVLAPSDKPSKEFPLHVRLDEDLGENTPDLDVITLSRDESSHVPFMHIGTGSTMPDEDHCGGQGDMANVNPSSLLTFGEKYAAWKANQH